jgi:hypothetical protein
MHLPLPPHTLYMYPVSHPTFYRQLGDIWRDVDFMTLFIMVFSPVAGYLVCLSHSFIIKYPL